LPAPELHAAALPSGPREARLRARRSRAQAYLIIASPLRHARRTIYLQRGAYHEWFAVWDGIFSLAIWAVAGWLAYTHVPQVHDFFQHFPENVQTIWNNIADSFHQAAAQKPPP
jgi:hypothetical protein